MTLVILKTALFLHKNVDSPAKLHASKVSQNSRCCIAITGSLIPKYMFFSSNYIAVGCSLFVKTLLTMKIFCLCLIPPVNVVHSQTKQPIHTVARDQVLMLRQEEEGRDAEYRIAGGREPLWISRRRVCGRTKKITNETL